MQLSFLMRTCFVYNNIIGFVTKVNNGCKCCGPSIKARWYEHLGNPMYNYLRVFLRKDHPYRRVASTFNGKMKRNQRLETMIPIDWIRAYDTKKEKEFSKLFDSNGEPLFDDPKFFDTYEEKMSIGMKRKSIFYELPYWEGLNIVHLLDPMRKFKNVSSYSWKHISSKKSDTLAFRRYLISLNIKKRQY